MITQEQAEASWIRLNEYEQMANAKFENTQERDFEKWPWRHEENDATQVMVQQMTARLARIEERQAVLYRMLHAVLGKVTDVVKWIAFLFCLILAAPWLKSMFA